MAVEDHAADDAIAKAVDLGWFSPLSHCCLPFEYHADSVSEIEAFFEESRRIKMVAPTYEELDGVFRSLHEEEQWKGSRLRCKRLISLAAFRKNGSA